jgi:hypothetical protein
MYISHWEVKEESSREVKTPNAKQTITDLLVHNQSFTSPLEEISDLLDNLPIE